MPNINLWPLQIIIYTYTCSLSCPHTCEHTYTHKHTTHIPPKIFIKNYPLKPLKTQNRKEKLKPQAGRYIWDLVTHMEEQSSGQSSFTKKQPDFKPDPRGTWDRAQSAAKCNKRLQSLLNAQHGTYLQQGLQLLHITCKLSASRTTTKNTRKCNCRKLLSREESFCKWAPRHSNLSHCSKFCNTASRTEF